VRWAAGRVDEVSYECNGGDGKEMRPRFREPGAPGRHDGGSFRSFQFGLP